MKTFQGLGRKQLHSQNDISDGIQDGDNNDCSDQDDCSNDNMMSMVTMIMIMTITKVMVIMKIVGKIMMMRH